MSRIRTVKPELFRHEELFELEQETGLPIRVSFIALFTVCDREGRFKWRPRQLKLDCLPYDEVDFSRVLDALITRGFVVRYEISGVDYGLIPSFTRHQVINNRESNSYLPAPPDYSSNNCVAVDYQDESIITEQSNNDYSRVSHASATRQPRVITLHKGKEREGKEGEWEGEKEKEKESRDAIASLSPTHTQKSKKVNSKPKAFDYTTIETPDFIDRALWLEWLDERKAQHPKSSQTETAIKSHLKTLIDIQNEGMSANAALVIAIKGGADGCWIGIEVDWIRNRIQKSETRVVSYQQPKPKSTKHDFFIPDDWGKEAIDSTAVVIEQESKQASNFQ